MYRIRQIDVEDFADELEQMHRVCFADGTPMADFDDGIWWVAFDEVSLPAAFLGLRQSILAPHIGYFARVGVLPEHRGAGLQRRLMRAMEQKARKLGWYQIVTDTRDNPHSANNIIAAGYRMFSPAKPWSFSDASYWTKELK